MKGLEVMSILKPRRFLYSGKYAISVNMEAFILG